MKLLSDYHARQAKRPGHRGRRRELRRLRRFSFVVSREQRPGWSVFSGRHDSAGQGDEINGNESSPLILFIPLILSTF